MDIYDFDPGILPDKMVEFVLKIIDTVERDYKMAHYNIVSKIRYTSLIFSCFIFYSSGSPSGWFCLFYRYLGDFLADL